MSQRPEDSGAPHTGPNDPERKSGANCLPGCPVCGGRLTEIRAKLQCTRCRTIYETCCEGGRG